MRIERLWLQPMEEAAHNYRIKWVRQLRRQGLVPSPPSSWITWTGC